MYLVFAGFNYSNSTNFVSGLGNFVADRSLVWDWLREHDAAVTEWLKQPHILALIMAWWITFIVVVILLFCIGFNPVGIGAGTLAAAFQAWAYGGFTPAEGIFATLTSLGMLGYLMPLEIGAGAVIATVVTVIVWACGVGQ